MNPSGLTPPIISYSDSFIFMHVAEASVGSSSSNLLGSATCPFFQNWSGRLTGFFNFCQIFRQVDRQVKKSSKKWTGLYLHRLDRFLPAQVEQVFTCTGSRQVVDWVLHRMMIVRRIEKSQLIKLRVILWLLRSSILKRKEAFWANERPPKTCTGP